MSDDDFWLLRTRYCEIRDVAEESLKLSDDFAVLWASLNEVSDAQDDTLKEACDRLVGIYQSDRQRAYEAGEALLDHLYRKWSDDD